MKLTKKQQTEIECLNYFAKDINYYKSCENINLFTNASLKKGDMTAEEAYFKITDSGEKEVRAKDIPKLLQLLDTKKWRLRMMDMYEQGIRDVPYSVILGFEPNLEKVIINGKNKWKKIKPKPIPEYVMEFMARTMFKGIDKKIIRELYYKKIKEIAEKFKK